MKILDESGLTHFSQKLSKTNKVISLKCTSVDKYVVASNIIDPMVKLIVQNVVNFCSVNNATLILKDNDNTDRGIASYIGNGTPSKYACIGCIDIYVFDSANSHAQAKIVINKGTYKKIS